MPWAGAGRDSKTDILMYALLTDAAEHLTPAEAEHRCDPRGAAELKTDPLPVNGCGQPPANTANPRGAGQLAWENGADAGEV